MLKLKLNLLVLLIVIPILKVRIVSPRCLHREIERTQQQKLLPDCQEY